MPAHGGQAALSDLEMTRAVAYMVSSGLAADPKVSLNARKAASGESIVAARCQECHASGANGAPKIGVMDDWKPRLAQGVGPLAQSAARGHKNMPARGGMPNLSDRDIRAAVEYMVARLGQR